jgi:hypothetical protein
VQGLFECQDRAPQEVKGSSTPLPLSRVVREGTAQSRFAVAVGIGLTPLVGREEELRVWQWRWTQAKEGAGQVVLLSGEAGIGKSRLVQALKEQVWAEGATRIEFRCSSYLYYESGKPPLLRKTASKNVVAMWQREAVKTRITQALGIVTVSDTPTAEQRAMRIYLDRPRHCVLWKGETMVASGKGGATYEHRGHRAVRI